MARVTNTLSDLYRDAMQFNIAITPSGVFTKLRFGLTIFIHRGCSGASLSSVASKPQRGAIPSRLKRSPGAQPLHQVVLTTPNVQLWWSQLGLRLNLASGTAYTPTVVGDINGDGLSNDRAFIPNPATTPDAALASQISELLATAPTSARQCLLGQLAQIAAANSCRGPWQTRLDFTLNFAPPQGVGLGDRLHFSTRFINAGAAIMRVVGASGALIQGSAPPDGRLLYVTGFDPVTQRFQYRVNQTFGQPLNFGFGNHQFPPFQVQLQLEYKLGVAPTNPFLRTLGLTPHKKAPQAIADVQSTLARGMPNPVEPILAVRDSLLLTVDQTAKLQEISRAYRGRLDSLTGPVAAYVLNRGLKLTDSDMFEQEGHLSAAIQPWRLQARDQSVAVLTADQKTKLAAMLAGDRHLVAPTRQ